MSFFFEILVRIASYGPQIDQSHGENRLNHIIMINIPSENLPKLSKERMQYFCHALKLNLRSRHSAASESNCSMNRSFEPKMITNFLQQRILCLILPASVKERIIAGKNTDVIVYVPIVAQVC